MVPPGREDEGRRAIACSYTGAAQATGGLGALDEEQPFLDAAHGDEPGAKVRINGPSPSKVAGVVVRIGIEATDFHEVGGGVVLKVNS